MFSGPLEKNSNPSLHNPWCQQGKGRGLSPPGTVKLLTALEEGDRDQRPDNLGFPARAAARTWRQVRGLVDITDISRCSVGGEPCLRVLSLSTNAGLLPPSLQILRPQSRTNGSDSSGCFQNILL